ncbi:MAG: hypothetical protein ABFD00_01965 [Chloroherpetonaceae bacterium]|nr:hypothetical protein [bacterium]
MRKQKVKSIRDQIEIYKHLSDVHRSQFDQRRQIEWKVFLSTLGIFATILVGKYANAIEYPVEVKVLE